MLSQEAISKILGIEEIVPLSAEEMADKMNITFYPYDKRKVSANVLSFVNKLEKVFTELRVNVVPYEKSLKEIPLHKSIIKSFLVILKNISIFYKNIIDSERNLPYIDLAVIPNLILKRNRVKPGISILAIGENETKSLPMDNTLSFRESSVITILDMPKNISKNTEFAEHFDTAMKLFAYHMTNIVIGVSDKNWVVYNFNASHPIYDFNEKEFKNHVLHALIPKIVAPIRPHRFSDFILRNDFFDINDNEHSNIVSEFVEGGKLFDETKLYPPGRKLDDLPFRNHFYRWIGKLHLDHRNGMSFGFLAWQMPSKLSEVISLKVAREKFSGFIKENKDYFVLSNGDIYVILNVHSKDYCIKIPPVWVLSQRSGSDKTRIQPQKDLIKMGLINGKMFLQTPIGLKLDEDYKPSFDTKVILAHAVGNSVVASLLNHVKGETKFVKQITQKGIALAHWHGYIAPSFIPKGWYTHGIDNPHVACSSPQSAIYAINGKFEVFVNSLQENNDEYLGDLHIEPHHGTNISFTSIKELATFFNEHPGASTLGNKYLYLYQSQTI